MKILISGAGIAGPTLAYWLAHYGMEPTIVEKSHNLRTGGYVIDFWGAGFDIADRMGLIPEIRRAGYMVEEVRVVNRHGKRVAGFPAAAFWRATSSHYVSLPRGDLAAIIFNRLAGRVETIFGNSVAAIGQTTDEQTDGQTDDQSASQAHVTFENGEARDFDLVIGADGLHSRTRELVFGAENKFEEYLGYKVAAFQVEGYQPRSELVYMMYTEVGQQVARFAMRDNRTMFLFVFADAETDGATLGDIQTQKALLRKRFGNSGWECPQILEALDATNDLYFDRVSQIRMGEQPGSWTRGRVTLLGDAAFCPSFLAGQGSALAMTAAYILAGELHRAKGDYAAAFARYQERFAPFVRDKQKMAPRFAGTFAPKSRSSMFFRNQVMNLLRIPWIAQIAVGRGLSDRIALPEYS